MLTAYLLWVIGLALALSASEVLVHAATSLGDRLRFSHALLGLLVALGADAPEVTSALVAAVHGSSDVSVGVVVGSNIYNLAGLLGLAALLAGRVRTREHEVPLDTAVDLLLTVTLIALILAPSLQVPLAVALLAIIVAYGVIEILGTGRVPVVRGVFHEVADDDSPSDIAESQWHARPLPLIAIALGSVAVIVVASDLLVTQSIYLAPRLGIPNDVMGTVVLAVSTSLPNTWAAVSLARRHRPEAAVGAAFNSNSINAAIGAGVPALFFTFHVAPVVRTLDIAWLGLMTVVAVALCALRPSLRRVDGGALLALYAMFLILRLAIFR